VLAQGEFAGEVDRLLAQPAIHPSRGDKRTTDHPPIYPTGAPSRRQLGDREWRLYELVARRFMATLADDAVMESNRVDISLTGEPFVARGTRVVHAGWFEYYPYTRQRDLELPELEKDDLVRLVDKQLEAKETQPPSRYGQGTLIELMEKHNLGTKATRHAIIQNLYDRGYVRGNPVEPTEMGIKMAEAIKDFAPRIASPEMTAELEKDMDLISVRDMTKEEVVTVSRKLLREAYGSLEQNKEQMASKIYEGISEDRILGLCPKCGKNRLRVIRSKTTKKRFVGCEGYPECDQTYPLPQRGEVLGTDEICPECGTPKVKVLGGRRPWVLCLDPYCPTKDEYRAKQAARAAREAAKGGEEASETVAAGATKKTTSRTRTTRASTKAATTGKRGAAGRTTSTRKKAKPADKPATEKTPV
jgi:DNA topoisomerase-1